MANRKQTYSPRVQSGIQSLGENLRVARLSRKMTVEDVAERAGVSAQTVTKLENGNPGVSVGNLAKILVVMQELGQLSGILDDSSRDPIAAAMTRRDLPKRIHPGPMKSVTPRPLGALIPDKPGQGF